MSDEAWIATIQRDRTDSGVRSVYADWLEERGDPRAAYLRAEVELAAFSPSDPRHDGAVRSLRQLGSLIDAEWILRVSRHVDLILESHRPDRAIYVIKAVYDILKEYRIPSDRSTLAAAVEIVRGSHFENTFGNESESNLPPYTVGQRRVVEVGTVDEACRLARLLEEAGATVSIHPSAHEVGRAP